MKTHEHKFAEVATAEDDDLDETHWLGENALLKAQLSAMHQEVYRLERLADTDTLTALQNRRAFERELDRAVLRFMRYGTPAAVIFFDVDRFKSVNDHHGHHVGDATLMFIANAMKALVRAVDTVARLGGDEFALILDHLDEAAARAKAQMIAEGIEAQSRKTYGIGGDIRLSWGLAAIEEGDSALSALARADSEMYAKRRAQRSER
jgi:diguanylate cyclase (GGDEF)-like protein